MECDADNLNDGHPTAFASDRIQQLIGGACYVLQRRCFRAGTVTRKNGSGGEGNNHYSHSSFSTGENQMGKKSVSVFLLIILVLVAGCGLDYECEVESDTSWSGSFGNYTVDGHGNDVVSLPDDPPICVVVQKETREGFLMIKLTAKGGGVLVPDKENDPVVTTAEFGVVSDCID